MIYVDSKGKRRRAKGFQLVRARNIRPAKYHLLLLINSLTIPIYCKGECPHEWRNWWDIPLQHGGDLAATAPCYKDIYAVSFREIPVALQSQVRIAIERICKHGLPMERDEHVFNNN